MRAGEEHLEEPLPGSPASRTDERMAEILSSDRSSIGRARAQLRGSSDADAHDLLSRLDALAFVDELVGQPGAELPERLGEYRITELLGRGGMGTVFEAFQESLERPVALKVLSPSLTSDPKMRRRFRIEARANATLHHQHIVPVYGFGEAAGHLYFTMERVDGVSLDKHIAARRAADAYPDPREVARRFAGVADALAHAHRRGILHRDVKPGNILVHPDGALALADFGLSKMLGQASLSVSAAGGFLGTLHYAAPEQARGQDFCPASDLYSLGVTLFETLTNQLPLDGKTTEAMLDAVLHGTPRRLSSVRPRAPRDLDAVLQKLLQKDPADRYTDGEALARDLLRVADDEPVRIRRHSVFVRAWRQVRKHPALSSAIAVAAALLLVVLWQWRVTALARAEARASDYRQLLVAASIELAQDAGEPAGPDGLLEALTGLDAGRATRAASVFEILAQAEVLAPEGDEPARMREAYASDPEPAATAALREGRGLVARQRLDRRISELERQWGFAARDAVTPMQLYRLYLSRAVAHLTPALGQPALAARDLVRASMIRRGAFFPRLLMVLVEWDPAERGADHLLARIDELVRDGPAGAGRTAGALLLALARIEPRPAANLMDFGLEYRFRRQLYLRGLELWGGPAPPVASGDAARAGLEARLRRHAESALRSSNVVAGLAAARQLLVDEVGPSAPLQVWGIVYDLVERQGEHEPSDAPELLEREVSALLAFLELDPDPGVVVRLRDSLRTWLEPLPRSSLGACKLRALLAAYGRAESEALAAADAWVRADSENPDAYLCRMVARAEQDDVTAAANDAVIALQKAVDRDAMRARIDGQLTARHDDPSFAAIRALFAPGG